MTFELDGKTRVAASPAPAAVVPLDDPQLTLVPALAERGKAVFMEKNCTACHGFAAIAAGGAPDLRASALALSAPAFEQVVRNGILQANGMPRFAELNDAELNSLYQYIRSRARESLAAAKAAK